VPSSSCSCGPEDKEDTHWHRLLTKCPLSRSQCCPESRKHCQLGKIGRLLSLTQHTHQLGKRWHSQRTSRRRHSQDGSSGNLSIPEQRNCQRSRPEYHYYCCSCSQRRTPSMRPTPMSSCRFLLGTEPQPCRSLARRSQHSWPSRHRLRGLPTTRMRNHLRKTPSNRRHQQGKDCTRWSQHSRKPVLASCRRPQPPQAQGRQYPRHMPRMRSCQRLVGYPGSRALECSCQLRDMRDQPDMRGKPWHRAGCILQPGIRRWLRRQKDHCMLNQLDRGHMHPDHRCSSPRSHTPLQLDEAVRADNSPK